MRPENCVLVKTAPEIALKSEPVRRFFTSKLVSNIKTALKKNSLGARIVQGRGRLFLHTSNPEKVQRVLSNAFGIHSTALCCSSKARTLTEIAAASVEYFKPMLKSGMSFAVRANRADAQGFTSRDIAVEAGNALRAAVPGATVNLSRPDLEAFIEARASGSYFYSGEMPCLGGLPLGAEGSIGFLFNGSALEAVAAFLLMRRGCHIYPILEKGCAAGPNISKLVKFNSYLEFEITAEEELESAISKRRLVALGSGERTAEQINQGSPSTRFQMPTLRPLLLYPDELLREKAALLGVAL